MRHPCGARADHERGPRLPAPGAPAANNDPAGANTTGTRTDVPNLVVSAPTPLAGDDLKDTNKVAAYATAKKAFDDYTAQAAKEPLAMNLADTVGHNKIAINFVWTLVTGFLGHVAMQAGFASWSETGLCRHQERRTHDDDEHDDLIRWACSGFISAASPSCLAVVERLARAAWALPQA